MTHSQHQQTLLLCRDAATQRRTNRPTFHVWGCMALLALLGGCAGGGAESALPDGNGTPNDPPDIQNSVCSDSNDGVTGYNTCHELERIGGLARSALRMSSLSFSVGYDRALARAGKGIENCPVSGTVTTATTSVGAIETTFTDCDFGIGPVTGVTRTAKPEQGSPDASALEVEVTIRNVRYEGVGSAGDLQSTIAQSNVDGSLTVGSAPSQRLQVTSVLLPEADGSLTHSLFAQHFIGTANAVVLQTSSPQFDKTFVSEKSNGFVVIELPFTRTARYTRVFSQPANSRFESSEANLAVEGRSLEGPLVNPANNGTESVSSTWDALLAAPRYDFAD